ncbi:MAG: AlkA N-terminal domain-containing protein [Planctomycetota bacterium]
MKLDPEVCYRAFGSQDRRFDGRIFVGVKTTRVYCRPICPAPTPKIENCVFFPSAAAASGAGFRPCLRCRPEASPETPAWLGTLATVARALRMIEAGALESQGVTELAARLGMGSRQLRRLFSRHLGASPGAVARTRRLHLAKKLIDETDMRMTRVAMSAGFNSIRRFNAVIRETYGRSASDLRRASRRASQRGLSLRLEYRAPLDWEGMLDFLRPRAIPGVESVDAGCYRRTCACTGHDGRTESGTIQVSPAPGQDALLLDVPIALHAGLPPIVARVRALFDLSADPAAIGRHLVKDERLREQVRARPGLRVPGAFDPFELCVRAVLGQQITVRAATTLAGRVATSFGEPLADGSGRLFPTPDRLAEADLVGLGLPRARAEAVRALAVAYRDGGPGLRASRSLDATLALLGSLPGVGDWTAQYIAMRGMGEPDAFPASDLGLRRALSGGAGKATGAEVMARSEPWRPWRAYAAMYLWTEERH